MIEQKQAVKPELQPQDTTRINLDNLSPHPHVPDIDDLIKERMLIEAMDFPNDDNEDLGFYMERNQ